MILTALIVKFALNNNVKILVIIHTALVVRMLNAIQNLTEQFVIAHLGGLEILMLNATNVSVFV